MKRSEWVKLCAARILQLEGGSPRMARIGAENCADTQEIENGASGIAWQSPEGAAEEFVNEGWE